MGLHAPRWKLAIEVDGDSHFTAEAMQYDEERTAYMKQFGIEVVRFTNLEILENLPLTPSFERRGPEGARMTGCVSARSRLETSRGWLAPFDWQILIVPVQHPAL